MSTWDVTLHGTKELLVQQINKEGEDVPGIVKQAFIQLLHVFNNEVELDLSSTGSLDNQMGTGNLEIHIDPYVAPPPPPPSEGRSTVPDYKSSSKK
jgi:hypothetical protein